jgi:hypothetical protein
MDWNDYNWRMDDMRDFVFVMFEGLCAVIFVGTFIVMKICELFER